MGIDSLCLSTCYGLAATDVGGVNTTCIEQCFKAAGWKEPTNPKPLLPLYGSILVSLVLLCLSGLFSGLNLGLLSLDLVSLRILEKAGEPEERKWASALIPVREKGNQLLCTVLFGGTVVNSGISILLAGLTSGVFGLIVSTFAIMILGEIIPQAYFCRNALKFGAKTLWIVRIFLFLFWPISWPIAFLLDRMVEQDIGTVYSQAELKHLIELHVEDPEAQKESGLTPADRRLLCGVFEYKAKHVMDVMTKLEDCFCLEQSMRLNFQTLSAIYLSGCSRIPVYHGDRQNIVGILFVKDLILVDPDDELEISTVMAFRSRSVSRVYEDVTLDKVLTKFLSGRSHMLIAHAAPQNSELALDGPAVGHTPVTGLITLEDVMEELISMEIYDETDAAVELKGDRRTSNKQHQQAMFMGLFEHKMRGPKLSAQEAQAVCSFLALNIEEFRSLASSDMAFRGLIRAAEVLEKSSEDAEMDGPYLGSSIGPYGSALWHDAASKGGLLYERGRATAYFTLILQGKVFVHTGDEGFDLDLGPWSHMGNKALHTEPYVPNFDAVAVPPYRIVRIHKAAYLASLDAMRLEHARGFQSIKQHITSRTQVAGIDGGSGGVSPVGESSTEAPSVELVSAANRMGSLPNLADAGPQPRSFHKQPSFRANNQVPHPMGSPALWGAEILLPPRPSSAGGLPGNSSSTLAPAAFWPRPLSPPPGQYGVPLSELMDIHKGSSSFNIQHDPYTQVVDVTSDSFPADDNRV